MQTLLQDLRFGLRMLRKNPGFTAVAALSLALGIGANTAIFTLLNAVMLKSLPVKDPDQLVLFSDDPSEGTSTGDPPTERWRLFSYPAYEYIRDNDDSFQSLSAFRSGEARMSVRMEDARAGKAAQRAQGHLVSGTYFEVLGVNALLGRTLGLADDSPAAEPAAVISYRYWKDRCESNPSVVGRTVFLNDAAFTIVGVAPPEFFGVRVRSAPDFWLPLAFQPQIELRSSYLTGLNVYWLNAVGRLKPGVTADLAQTSLTVSLRQFLRQQAGEQLTEDRKKAILSSSIQLAPGGPGISGLRFFYSRALHVLMAVVALILLIACANAGNLLLSKSASRRLEVTMRVALGASRSRLIKQMLTESLLLAALGGMLGLLFASWSVSGLIALVAPTVPLDLSPDLLVLGFTSAVSVLAGILFGLAPAIRASRIDLSTALKEKVSRGEGRLRFGLASALVVSQVAISLVLLTGAGLFTRSLIKLKQEELGFQRENVLLVDLDPRLAGYKPAQLNALYQQLLDRLSALPGISSVTMASYSPMSGMSRTRNVTVQGYASETGENLIVSDILIAPGYCETLGLPLLLGREIGPEDTPASPRVAVVNNAFADYFFRGQNPLGRRFDFGAGPHLKGETEIVGVIGDAKYGSAWEKPGRTVYRPVLQIQTPDAYECNLEIRTLADPLAAAPEVRAAIAQVDEKLPIVNLGSLSGKLESSLHQERLIAQLAGFFGLLAVLLSCIGLHGVIANAVTRRTNEIGIRMALGAGRRAILWMVLRETLILVGLGILIGVPAALGATQLISSQLFGLSPGDPVTLFIAAALLACVAVLAGYMPARRATRVDPVVALRYE